VYVYPGGGITVMADVSAMPDQSFGYVPTPAIVAPIEFTMPEALYRASGGHSGDIIGIEDVIRDYTGDARIEPWTDTNPWPFPNTGKRNAS